MTWSRFDDQYDEREKIEDAWFACPPNPIGLHVMATTACNRSLSDGVIRPRWLENKLKKPADRDKILALMVEHGLFDLLQAGDTTTLVDEDGNEIPVGPFDEDRYIVHDFLDFHESSVQVKARRQRDAERKRRGRRPDSNGTPSGVQPDSTRTPRGLPAESNGSPPHARERARAGASRPDPTRPLNPPSPPRGERVRERAAFEEQMKAWAGEHFPGAEVGAVQYAIDILRGRRVEPTPDAIRAYAQTNPACAEQLGLEAAA